MKKKISQAELAAMTTELSARDDVHEAHDLADRLREKGLEDDAGLPDLIALQRQSAHMAKAYSELTAMIAFRMAMIQEDAELKALLEKRKAGAE